MKLLQCPYSSFYSLQLLANFARRRRTLSAITKKPASLAGFSYLRLCLTRLTSLFLLLHLTFRYPARFSVVYSNSNLP
jgi:hypothetical protein